MRHLLVALLVLLLCACDQKSGLAGGNQTTRGATPQPTPQPTPKDDDATVKDPRDDGEQVQTSRDEQIKAGGDETLDDSEFTDRLEQQGAQTGEIQISLIWNNTNDLDLHVVTPRHEHLHYLTRRDAAGGFLDVDMNAGGDFSETGEDETALSITPVENVYWSPSLAPHGHYAVHVHHFRYRGGAASTAFKVRVKIGPKVKVYSGSAAFQSLGSSVSDIHRVPADAVLVTEFDY